MRAVRVLAVSLAVLALPATAGAQLQPTPPGVTATRAPGGRITIRFAATPAGRAAYRRYAGRLVTVRCQHVGDQPFGTRPVDVVTTPVRMARSLSSIRLRVRGSANLCSLGRPLIGVTVATDATGRRFLADVAYSVTFLTTNDELILHGTAAALRQVANGVRLSTAGATPPRGGGGGLPGGRGTPAPR